MPDPLKMKPGSAPGAESPRFVHRVAPPGDGGTMVMIAAAILIALALLYLVFSVLL